MASVSYLQPQLPDPDDEVVHHHHSHPDQTLTLGSLAYWAHDLHFFSSDPDFPRLGEVSLHDSLIVSGPDFLDHRENQVNFVIDLFHQRVEQSQVIPNNVNTSSSSGGDNNNGNASSSNHNDSNAIDLVSDALTESGFGVIDENHELGVGNLELDLGLGFGSLDAHESNCGFFLENIGGSDVEVDICGDNNDDDGFLVERRVSALNSGEAASSVSVVETFRDSTGVVGFGSDSEDDDNVDENGDFDDYGLDHMCDYDYDYYDDDGDESVSIPLCWDSLQLEDRRETNEDFEWEEVDGRLDEREILSVFVDDDEENSVSLSISPIIAQEDAASVERAAGFGNLEWEVLLNSRNLEANQEMDESMEPYGDHDNYISTAEMLFGHFVENENAFLGRPPASKSVVENLPSVVLTQEDVESINALCAVCKDEINVGEKVKQLPCGHNYHGECIVPWLIIRNTCPVCRHELPTDDADYERRRLLRAGRGL